MTTSFSSTWRIGGRATAQASLPAPSVPIAI
jgi:hypothetical protein